MDSSSLYGIAMWQTEFLYSQSQDEEKSGIKIKRIGVDLEKNVYQLHGVDDRGKAVWKRRLSRGKWLAVLCDTVSPGTVVGMEACAGAHHWARELTDRGYEVKIIPPQFVKPFVRSNKNDANDAQAICEAMERPNMHPVLYLRLFRDRISELFCSEVDVISQIICSGGRKRPGGGVVTA